LFIEFDQSTFSFRHPPPKDIPKFPRDVHKRSEKRSKDLKGDLGAFFDGRFLCVRLLARFSISFFSFHLFWFLSIFTQSDLEWDLRKYGVLGGFGIFWEILVEFGRIWVGRIWEVLGEIGSFWELLGWEVLVASGRFWEVLTGEQVKKSGSHKEIHKN